MSEIATLAGGCFWCTDAGFVALKGVEKVVSGYMGGSIDRPTYEQVCSGTTGHAEVVQIHFDPTLISYRDLLEVFFVVHDPTTLNRQGNDTGTQYRSAIFWHTPGQKADAEAMVAGLASTYANPIVTEITEATTFWPAEDYHQDYFANNPRQPYCQFVVAPKVVKVRTKFAERLK
ncbi:MAG: peptide-methionine (S)-S-oxide reductase MsrA [Parasulfuritortus sp.]|nr:peptide-methionine (S)-S-oxide reductase MsrA [Parasulfuritortus sp.]